MLNLKLLMFVCVITGCTAPPCTDAPGAVWPLGTGDACEEIIQGGTDGTIGNIDYVLGYTAIGMQSAMKFSGSSDSYVDLRVPGSNLTDDTEGDYSMRFYVYFDSIVSGTIFNYRSDSYGEPIPGAVTDIEVFVQNENIGVQFTGYGSVLFNISAVTGVWIIIIVERDVNQDGPKIYFENSNSIKLTIDASLKFMPTRFPGTLRLGGNFAGNNALSGKVACFQYIPCKNPTSATYDNYCSTQLTTTSTTTTTTTEQPTTTTTEQPTTTTTEQPITTTSEQPTTTTTEQPTTTTTEQPTTTTSEKPTTTTSEQPTTTTTEQLTTSTTTTEQPATTTTTTTEQPATTTLTTTEQPATTTITTTGQPQLLSTTRSPAQPYNLITGVCQHFTKTGTDVTFQNTSDIIDIILVRDTVSCSYYCTEEPSCSTFVVTLNGGLYECRIGLASPMTTHSPGSMLYEL